jgi:pantoate--beta-alanine ligase
MALSTPQTPVMILFKQADKLSQYLEFAKKSNKKIGFVPTMGALHDGHLSLIKASKKQNELTVCSIFVNPTQFNNAEDFDKYPITMEADLEKLLTCGCDVLFHPTKEEVYPTGFVAKHYQLGELENVLEGLYRPGHFQGVCQVMDRLLEIVLPDNLYLGAKDFQQCKVITKLVSIIRKEEEIKINIQPTFRESDGLAMSSRNLRLSNEQRGIAPTVFKALTFSKDNMHKADSRVLEKQASALLNQDGFKVDYFQIVDADSLQPAEATTQNKIAVVAAYLGNVRLIDNLYLS